MLKEKESKNDYAVATTTEEKFSMLSEENKAIINRQIEILAACQSSNQ